MAAVLNNAFLLAVMRVFHELPTVDALLRSMNSEEALRDGSRFL